MSLISSRLPNAMPLKLTLEFNEQKVDQIFAEFDQCRLPGVAVGIAVGGKPIYRKGFGLANMELPVTLSPTMRMRIGSTTKHFVCFAYMLLCEEGKAGIDDLVGKYLPELHSVTRAVTMRQLMGHVSGLRDARDIGWQFSGLENQIQTADVLSLYRDIDDVNSAPGSSWRYNNGAFVILTGVIEAITGQSLEDVLRQRVFDPVGMYDTLLRRFDTDFVPNSASMHMTDGNGEFNKSYLAGALAGEGGMASTVDDMLLWLAHMDAPRVGSKSTWATMRAPQVLKNGTSTGYGLGLSIGQYRGADTVHHAGGMRGANAQMLKIPAAGLDVVVMSNRHDASSPQLVNKVLDACLPGLDPIPKRSRAPHRGGTFRSPTTGRVLQLLSSSPYCSADDSTVVVSVDGTDQLFELCPDGVLRPASAGAGSTLKWAVRLTGDQNRVAAAELTDFGAVDELVAVTEVDRVNADEIAGEYLSDATRTRAAVQAAGSTARLKTIGRFGAVSYDLECIGKQIWRARSASSVALGGIITFDSHGFVFSTYCTRALPFRRL